MAKIGRYEIESEIGRGSMGVVHLAHDPHVRRRVAVKTFVLPSGLSAAQEREFSERFLREAQAAGALSHPAIVTIYDADTNPETGHPYIAMEYVEGRSLRQIFEQQGHLSALQALAMAGTLAEALHVAHEAGIVHRDIKPANILVRERDGQVKIVDFGVARLATSDLTGAGDVFGSPAYMSPEQFRGLTVDARSDLFSLGTILYQALCGERPFAGGDLSSLAYSVVHTIPPALSSRIHGLPAELDRFFEKALAKEPESRFQDGLAFKRALEEIKESVSRPVLPAPPAGERTPMPERSVKRGKGISTLEGTFAVVMLILALLPGLWALWSSRGSSSPGTGGSPRAEAAAPAPGDTEAGVDPELETPVPSRKAQDGKTADGRSGKLAATGGLAPASKYGGPGSSSDPRGGRSPVAAARGTRKDPVSRGAIRSRKGAFPLPTDEIQNRSSEAPAILEEPLATMIEPQSAPPRPLAQADSYLLIDAKSMVKLGKLTVLVDGKEAYSRDLSTQESGSDMAKKKLFRRKQEHFSARIRVSPGKHEIVALVVPDGMSAGFRDRTMVDLKVSESLKLQLVAGRLIGSPVSLKAD